MSEKNKVASSKALHVVQKGAAVAIEASNLEATRNFFYANRFRVFIEGSELHLFFGQGSVVFGNKLNMAIEVVFPVATAVESLYESVFIDPGANGTQSFADSVRSANRREAKILSGTSRNFSEIGADNFSFNSQNFRQINANYARFAFALNEGMIEFYEANPILIHSLTSNQATRKNDGIHSVFAVICSTEMLDVFLEAVREILEPIRERFIAEERI